MNTLDAINSRHSYRGKYKDIAVPRSDLIKIIQAGISAPSGCNRQTTSFIAVDDKKVLAELKGVIDPPVGVAEEEIWLSSRLPKKKAFDELAWFNCFGNSDNR